MTREEAIEMVRKSWPISRNIDLRKALETLIPELTENEDEKILASIADCVSLMGKDGDVFFRHDVTKEDVLAWLEKQKEQNPNIEICPHSIKSKSYKENWYPIEDCDYGLEIAFDILEKTFGEVRGYQTDDGIREHQTAIEAVRKAKEQKPAEWSEEDERMIDTIVSVLGQYIDYKAVSGTGSGYATPRYNKEIDWLKSLRPSWKPSEEQMDRLFSIIAALRKDYCDDMADFLANLRTDLKKLGVKEEPEYYQHFDPDC